MYSDPAEARLGVEVGRRGKDRIEGLAVVLDQHFDLPAAQGWTAWLALFSILLLASDAVTGFFSACCATAVTVSLAADAVCTAPGFVPAASIVSTPR